MTRPTKKPTNRRTSRSRSQKSTPIDTVLDNLQRAADYIHEVQPTFTGGLIIEFETLIQVVQKMATHLNGGPTHAHQTVALNVARLLGEKVNPAEGGKLSEGVVQDALRATEDLTARAAYFVGCAVGVEWGLEQCRDLKGRNVKAGGR